MTAFRELNSCRVLGFGEGPIPWSAISDWCNANDVSEETRAEVFFFVRELDNEYLKYLSEKRAKDKGKD